MQYKILAVLAGSLLALSIGAFAAGAPPPGGPTPTHADPGFQRMMPRHGDFRGHPKRRRDSAALRASLRDINAITRLYRTSGRYGQLAGFYRDVLNKTQNPILRNYVHMRLARLQSTPKNADAAIATLRKSLDENLARLESPKQDRHK